MWYVLTEPVAGGLVLASVRVEVDVSDGPHHAVADSVGVNNVNEVGVSLLEPGLLVELEQRAGGIES